MGTMKAVSPNKGPDWGSRDREEANSRYIKQVEKTRNRKEEAKIINAIGRLGFDETEIKQIKTTLEAGETPERHRPKAVQLGIEQEFDSLVSQFLALEDKANRPYIEMPDDETPQESLEATEHVIQQPSQKETLAFVKALKNIEDLNTEQKIHLIKAFNSGARFDIQLVKEFDNKTIEAIAEIYNSFQVTQEIPISQPEAVDLRFETRTEAIQWLSQSLTAAGLDTPMRLLVSAPLRTGRPISLNTERKLRERGLWQETSKIIVQFKEATIDDKSSIPSGAAG